MLGLFKRKKKQAHMLAEIDRGINIVRFNETELKQFVDYMAGLGVELKVQAGVVEPKLFSLEKLSTIKCQKCGKRATSLAHYRKNESNYVGYVAYCDEHIKPFEKSEAKEDDKNISTANNAKPKSDRTNRKTSRRR